MRFLWHSVARPMFVIGLVLASSCNPSNETTTSDPTLPGGPGGPGSTPPTPGGSTPAPGSSTPGPGPGGEPPPETPIPYAHFDVNHVLSTGQSNSVAHEGRPPI